MGLKPFSKAEILVVGFAFVLLLALYFFVRTTPKLKVGAPEVVELDDSGVLLNAKSELDSIPLLRINELEAVKAQAKTVTDEIEGLKELSKTWNELGNFTVGGFYAKKVAELEDSETAWAIAGNTYGISVQRIKEQSLKRYAILESIKCFEKALSITPENSGNRYNLALMKIELSGVDPTVPPMTGILMLRDILEKEPENITVIMALGRLSVQSGQWEKAIGRFERVVELQPTDSKVLLEAHFMLKDAYSALKNPEKVIENYEAAIRSADDKVIKDRLRASLEEYKLSN